MAEGVQLGAAYVTFTGDFADLMKGIDDAVKMARKAAKDISDAFKGIEIEVRRTRIIVTREFVLAATSSVRVWNMAMQAIRSGLRKLTAEMVFLQLDVSHLGNMFKRMSAVGVAAMGGMSAAAITFEDAFANVRKTVDASEAEFRQLERSLRQMSTQTRTSASDLALIMSTAGQLGVRGADNLTKFTRTIDMLQVATNIVGQEGAQALAQFMNIMQENLGNVDRVGAAITELGNNFAATEADILNMAQRLAGAGKTVGLTTADVLGLATALSAVGIRAEMGGSALSRVLINMSQAVEMNDERLREFARTAGMSTREFADAFRRDPVRALRAFIEGLRRLDSEGKNVFATLENVGASEIRVRDTVLRLFQASDLLADAVERSNRAWEENIALTEEFDRFMGTGVARLRVMWNTIVEVARIVGDVYNPVIKQAADFTQGVADALRRMTPEQAQAIAEFGAMTTAVLGSIAAFLLGVKAITTLGTGLVLLTRAVMFFLSPWTLAVAAVIAASVAIASKWDEIIAKIENTDLGQAAKRTWDDLVKVWQSDELTLPEKVLESVKITVETVLGLTESIIDWFVNSSIDLVRDVAVELGVDWESSKLGKLIDQIQEWWNDEDITLTEKVLGVVTVFAGIRWMLRALTSFASAVAATAGLRAAGAGWWFRLGLVTVSTPLKWVPVAAGATMFMMPKETREQLREQVSESFRQFRTDIDRIWGEEFGEEWRQALERASEEGRIFDPLTVIVENITKTVSAFRESLAPVTAIIRDWVAGVFGEVSLSEAFQRGLEREEIDPKAAALWQSLINLGTAIGELLMESIAAAFDVVELISLLFVGPLATVGTMLVEVGAYWAGAISQGFMEEWGKLEEWFRNTWLGRTLVKLGIIEPPGPTEMDILGMSPEERRELVRDVREAIGETELKARPTLWERIFPPTVGRWQELREEAPPSASVRQLIEKAAETSRLSSELLLVLAQQESSMRAMLGSGGPFQLRSQAFEDVRRSGFRGPFDTTESLVEAGVRYADIMLRYFEHYRPQIEEQMASLGIDAAQAFSIAWVTGIRGFLGLESLEEVITVVDGKAQTAAERLEQMARAMDALGIPGVRLPGFREGVILPGYGGGDRIPALLEPGEAVVPARVVRGGLSDIVAWFRSMGVTKMKDGGIAGILAAATPREALAIAQAEQEAVSREMSLFANRMLEGMQEITNTMSLFIFGAAQMIVDVLKALFPEAADSIQKGFDDFKAWWERSFRQERKAAAQAPEEAAPTLERTPAPAPTAEERSWWERLLETTQELVAATRDGFRDMRPGLEGLKSLFPGGAFAEAVDRLSLDLYHIGKIADLFETGWDKMVSGFDRVLEGFRKFFGDFGSVGAALAGFQMAGGGPGGILGAIGGLIGGPIGLGLGIIGSLFGGSPRKVAEPREFNTPDPLRGGLRAAIEERERLIAKLPELESELRRWEAAVRARSQKLFPEWGSRKLSDAKREVDRVKREIQNLERAIEGFEVREFLGFTADDIARTIESGFDMADMSNLGQSLEGTIQSALLRAWVASDEMLRLQDVFGDQLERVLNEFIKTGKLQADALDPLRATIAGIVERGEAFAEVLKELGFTTEELNEKFGRMIRNIPQGYRVERAIFEASPPRIPALAAGGIVTRPTLALVGEAGPEAVVPLDRGGIGGVYVHIERMEVQDGRDFGRRLDEELRRRGLVAAGNVTAWRGRR